MNQRFLMLGTAALLCACQAGPEEGPGTLVHTFPALEIGAGAESTGNCQSWTLDNDRPVYVNAVAMEAGPAWHHSNWFFVPDTMYSGPDGTWRCNERDFSQEVAAANGGVLFAQSTQVLEDVQQFPGAAAVVVPPGSRIIGNVHLVNASTEALETAITLEIRTLPRRMVDVELKPMSLIYRPLDIPPQATSEFGATCDVMDSAGQALDFSIYYVLPHYHSLGLGMRLSASGGPSGTHTIMDVASQIGEPLGGPIDPPMDVSGSTELTFGCTYQNLSTDPVYWGNADGEMCLMLAFTDSPRIWAGGVLQNNAVVGTDGNGVILNEGPCSVYRL